MAEAPLVLTIESGIARLTLDRPDLGNALTSEASKKLGEAIDRIAADPGVRVVVLTGNGKMFSAGGDIREFVTTLDSLADLIGDELVHLNETLLKLAALPVPVIAALNGPVAGGGIGLALTADVVISAASARFRAGYAAIGLSPDAGTSYQLTRLMGPQRAKEFLFTNRFLDSAEALAVGLVAKVVPDADLVRETDAMARTIAAMPPGALAAVKSLVNAAATESHAAILAREREWMMVNAATPDAREGIRAFMERRAPAFAASV
ncbi:MAG: enoyl-CoA hydratase/isomerase family protein [Candidatus Eremiobacteraeota bacterium]|nr:enoyl-CoA hydratase/isomerase family protein [Candidatus Eremiobacteraeota bacterium]